MKNREIKKISIIDWTQRWSGSYTFISCSYWGPQYYYTLQKILKVNFKHILFFHRKGTVDFYVASKELHHLGRTLAKRSFEIKKYSRLIKQNTDLLTSCMSKLKGEIPKFKKYQEFLKYFDRHLAYHGFIKEPVDYLSPQDLKRLLPYFEDARKYSEKIYSDTEVFFRDLAKTIAKKEKINWELLTCLTQNELEVYLKEGRLPDNQLLKIRYDNSALYFTKGKSVFLNAKEANLLENEIIAVSAKNKKDITGISAYVGKVKATCRVIPDPYKYKKFNPGEILITGMTRPEFLPLFKLSSAVVTDSGGILSHAAITARELKIPCVIGTKIATKVFKDGDMVEVDANKGIVRKI
jgi:phosphoenolpyruvate synthase/pyruvate phosphate dikinase